MTTTHEITTAWGATRRIRAWIREHISDVDSVKAPEITQEAIEAFMDQEDVVRALLEEQIKPLVYELVMTEIKDTRRDAVIDTNGHVVSRKSREQSAKQKWTRFQRWLEYDGMHHHRLLAMNKQQLQDAARTRRVRAKTEMDLARFMDVLAGGLEEGQTVEDAYTYQEIEAIYLRCVKGGKG